MHESDFPILAQKIHGARLAYLDSAASAQKPRSVIDAMTRFYEQDYANIHRGAHELSARATAQYEAVRGKIQKFINAEREDEIVFTKGTTDGINLIAFAWGRKFLKAGDEVLITELEHHANIVPWQMLRDEIGIKLQVAPITSTGEITPEAIKQKLSSRTKLVSVAHVSNALGTVLPIAEIIKLAHSNGSLALIDGAQSISHETVDVQALDADFYVFSAHKLYGPTGVGALYGKRAILESMPPYQGGGDMIESVTFAKTTFKSPPHRFEAGTPPITETIGMGAAIDYVSSIGMSNIKAYEAELLNYATERLKEISGVRIMGTAPVKAGVISFIMDCAHPHDIGTVLDRQGVAIRTGHHCAQPVMEALSIPATARASFGLYNTKEDIDALVAGIKKVKEIFS
ncbi:MAG: cysteine desulfurase [Alphaproteobacteria bacterium]|nr:cysteine desulfurase [Alphaproteobacteria bacterium]